jgi:hypothetical protein
MTEPQFQRLAKSGGYSLRGLRERMGIHRILKARARPLARTFLVGPVVFRANEFAPSIPAAQRDTPAMGRYCSRSPTAEQIRAMIRDDIREALSRGDKYHANKLLMLQSGRGRSSTKML